MSLLSWLSPKPLLASETYRDSGDDFTSEEGFVVQKIPPGGKGKIRLYGVYWNAKANTAIQFPIPENTLVHVKERIGLTLLVEPVPFVTFSSVNQHTSYGEPHASKATRAENPSNHTAA